MSPCCYSSSPLPGVSATNPSQGVGIVFVYVCLDRREEELAEARGFHRRVETSVCLSFELRARSLSTTLLRHCPEIKDQGRWLASKRHFAGYY